MEFCKKTKQQQKDSQRRDETYFALFGCFSFGNLSYRCYAK
jgi:hypothetical protein